MAYRLNEDNSILYNGNVALLKAANDVGKNLLINLLKVAKGAKKDINVLPLNYEPKQDVWLDLKGKYILFDLSKKGAGLALVEAYQEFYDKNAKPDEATQVANVSGGLLATDGGVPIHTNTNSVIDVPKENEVKQEKIKKELEK